MLIVIDPGHGGRDPGAVRQGVVEKEINLTVASDLARLLSDTGWNPVLTRTGDYALGASVLEDLKQRVALSNSQNADVFLSLHCNAVTATYPRGEITFCHRPASKGVAIGQAITSCMKCQGVNVRPIVTTSNLYVVRYTSAPAVLVEMGFLSNDLDRGLLTDPVYQALMAMSIATGLNAWKEGVCGG